MPPLSLAATTDLGPYAVAMAFGFVVGVLGHITKSRTLIIAGIVIVGGLSAYFAFVVGKLGQ